MIKKLICALLATLCLHPVYAANTANIKIKIAGAPSKGFYLCMPDLGCLSIQAGNRGKVFAMRNNVEMNTLFVTNANTMRVYNQGLPNSCNVTVKQNQTITITGTINTQSSNVKVANLRCSVS